MSKLKITVEFKRTISYQAEIEVTEEEYFLLKEVDGADLWEHDKHSENNRKEYHLLEMYADENNAFDWENELSDFEIVQDDNSESDEELDEDDEELDEDEEENQ